ncbi:MAG: hypothetical protein FJX76_06275 [Armatimonadetes bacterium]|nr:hypothetical protein [Armatimonadota bacterium]
MALVEGRSPNRYDQLDGFVDSLPQGKRVAVLLGGPSGAGKTRLIEKLQECAGDRKVKVVEGDMFFWGTDCPGGIPKTKTGEIYWDHERYMDIPRLQNDLSTLLATGKVDLPVYDFNPRPGSGSFIGHRSDETRHVEVGADDIIVVDSVHAVNKSIVDTLETNQLPYRILFLDSPLAEERLIRRIVREYDVRGSLTAETTLNLWDNSTYQGEVEFIRPHLMSMDPARDLTMTLEFPSDVRMSRKEVGERVAAMAKYGLSPGYEAFRVKEDELPELAIREEQRLVDVLATSKDEKALARAQKELDLLRNAPAYRKA